MPDTKISALGAASALGGTEAIPAVQAGGNVRLTPAQIATYVMAGAQPLDAELTALAGLTSAANKVPYFTGGGSAGLFDYVRASTATTDPTASSDSAAGYVAGSSWLNTATGLRWTCLDAGTGAAVWSPAGASDHPGYVSGLFYPAQRAAGASTAVAADTLYAVPIYIAQRVTLSGLGVRVGTGVASTAVKLGLYANIAGRPGGLIAAGGGSAATTVTSSDAVASFATSLAIGPGVFWIAAIYNGAPTILCINGGDQLMSGLIGAVSMGNSTGTSNQVTGVTGSGATYAGGLPSTFGAATNLSGSSGIPIANIKIA